MASHDRKAKLMARIEREDDLIRETPGDHIFDHFLAAKRSEWNSYIRHVSPWEIDRYLNAY